jgi:hypothetical protein
MSWVSLVLVIGVKFQYRCIFLQPVEKFGQSKNLTPKVGETLPLPQ